MIFYTVEDDDAIEREIACATLAEARRVRAGCAPGDGRIRRYRTPAITREVLCNVFNRHGFATEQTEIADSVRETTKEED